MAIRVAVTGRTATPPLFDTLVALGRDRTLERLGPGHRERSPSRRDGRRRPARASCAAVGLLVGSARRRSARASCPDGCVAGRQRDLAVAARRVPARVAACRTAAGPPPPASVRSLFALVGYYAMIQLRYGYGGVDRSRCVFWGLGALVGGPGLRRRRLVVAVRATAGGGPARSGCSPRSPIAEGVYLIRILPDAAVGAGFVVVGLVVPLVVRADVGRPVAATSRSSRRSRSALGPRAAARLHRSFARRLDLTRPDGRQRRMTAPIRTERDLLTATRRRPGWLDRYVDGLAIRTTRTAIGDAVRRGLPKYRYHACDPGRPIRGSGRRSSPTGSPDQDEPGSWTAHYDACAFEGEPGVGASGRAATRNPDGSFRTLYYNHWLAPVRRPRPCVEFIEYFMELPETAARRAADAAPASGSDANAALTRVAILSRDGTHDPRRRRRAHPARDARRGARGRRIPGRVGGRRPRGAGPLPRRAPGPRPARPDAPRAVRASRSAGSSGPSPACRS